MLDFRSKRLHCEIDLAVANLAMTLIVTDEVFKSPSQPSRYARSRPPASAYVRATRSPVRNPDDLPETSAKDFIHF